MTEHDRVLASGVLGGLATPTARKLWPVRVRRHVASCAECLVLIQVARLLRPAGATPGPTISVHRVGTVEELRRRPVPPAPRADVVAGDCPRFSRRTYRRAGGGLELEITGNAAHAWDPDARHLMLFSTGPDEVRLLAQAVHPDPGVRVEATLPLERGGRVVALSLAGESDSGLWELWLAHHGWAEPLRAGRRLRAATLSFQPSTASTPLRLLSSPLPPAGPEIARLLAEAVALGQSGRERDAAVPFAAARALGFRDGDAMGKARGGIGLGIALFSIGYGADATAVLTEVLSDCELDAHRAGQAFRSLAWQAFLCGDLASGERRAAQAEEVQPGSPWAGALLRHAAILREDWAGLLHLDLADPPDANGLDEMRAYQMAIAHSLLRQPRAAGERIAGLGEAATLEVRLWRFVALACLSRAETGAWPALGKPISALLSETQRGAITVWEAAPLALLFTACRAEVPGAVTELIHTRFLHGDAADRALCVAAGADGVFSLVPRRPLRRLPVDRTSLVEACGRLRRGAILGENVAANLVELSGWLFPAGPPTGELVIASDGCLAGVPWPLLLASDDGVPPVTEALGRGACARRVPASARIVTLADPLGDLHLARAMKKRPGDLSLVGDAATSLALREIGEAGDVGLFHLAVHVERERGAPELLLADGPLGAAAVAGLRLIGEPVVLIAACGSAAQWSAGGAERSLADAFLRAGASAVVATRWPLTDLEARDVSRPLLARWPFGSAERAAADTATTLRRAGEPARIWASLAVYRA